jgi:tRNA nucleotidyltransferase (CCA-adding enzyme)
LRHVSDAFEEDPLRVLRVARFMARFAHLGFRVDDTTSRLMQTMCQEGQLRDLPKERIWKEVSRALMEPTPSAFFETLRACHGLDDWFTEIKALIGVEQPPEHHPEICTFRHTLLALDQAHAHDLPVAARWAVVCHDLGKALTPAEERPSHHGHEEAGVPLVETLSRRVGAPKDALTLARQLCAHHTRIHRAQELSAKKIIELVQLFDGLRRPDNFQLALKAAKCDALGRTGFEHKAYPQEEIMTTMLNALKTINEGDIARTCQDNPKLIPQRIHQERMRVIKSALKEQVKIRTEKLQTTSDHTLG